MSVVGKLTYEDYCTIPDDGLRHEIINGEHFVSPSPLVRHQIVLWNLNDTISYFFRDRAKGISLFAPVDVRLSEHDIVQPDLVVVLADNDIVTERMIDGAPDFIVEILSPSTAAIDRGRKRDLYERSGVREYWIVDPDAQTVDQLVLENGRYAERKHGETIEAAFAEGVRVELSKLWR